MEDATGAGSASSTRGLVTSCGSTTDAPRIHVAKWWPFDIKDNHLQSDPTTKQVQEPAIGTRFCEDLCICFTSWPTSFIWPTAGPDFDLKPP